MQNDFEQHNNNYQVIKVDTQFNSKAFIRRKGGKLLFSLWHKIK